MCLFCLFCIKGAVASREHQVPSKPCFVNKLDYTQMARMYFSGSTGARIFLHSCLDPPTLKNRPSIANAMEHDQTRSHRLKLRSGLLNAFDQPCLHASCPPHARHAASTPHAAMTVTMTPCTQERACKRWRGRDSFKSHS